MPKLQQKNPSNKQKKRLRQRARQASKQTQSLTLTSATILRTHLPWSSQGHMTGAGLTYQRFLINSADQLQYGITTAPPRFANSLQTLFKSYLVENSEVELRLCNTSLVPVLISLHLSTSDISYSALTEISTTANTINRQLSSAGGNKESIVVKKHYNHVAFNSKERGPLNAQQYTMLGSDPLKNPMTGVLPSALFLHVYAADLSGSGATIDVAWWAIVRQSVVLRDLDEDAQ